MIEATKERKEDMENHDQPHQVLKYNGITWSGVTLNSREKFERYFVFVQWDCLRI